MSAFIDALVRELEDDPEARTRLRQVLGTPDPKPRTIRTKEAAERLGMHPRTLTDAARAGRVVGARKSSPKVWVYDESVLEVLPPIGANLGSAGPGIPRRPLEPSSTVQSIRSAAPRRAA